MKLLRSMLFPGTSESLFNGSKYRKKIFKGIYQLFIALA